MPPSEQWELVEGEWNGGWRSHHAAANKPPVARVDVNTHEMNNKRDCCFQLDETDQRT